MSREDIVAVAVRLFAVYLLLMCLRLVAGGLMSINGEAPDSFATGVVLVSVAVTLAISALLWFFPLTLARKLLPVMKETPGAARMDPAIAWSLAISIIGLWIFVSALSSSTYWLVIYLRSQAVGMEYMQFSPGQIASIVETAVELLLGLALMLGSGGLRSLIFRLRNIGPDYHR